MTAAPDSLTILRARGRRLAKRMHLDGRSESYDQARTFTMHSVAVPDLNAIARLLAQLLPRPDCCVIRGESLDPARTDPVRRLLYADRETGNPPTLQERARHWLALDVEGVPLPSTVPPADLRGCAAAALAELPPQFTGARCIVQATAGHGFKPDLRLRMWFWCARPLDGAELKRWLRGTPADPSVFGAAQLIYTAKPLFAPGCADPLPARLLVLDGAEHVMPPPPAMPAAPQSPPPRPSLIVRHAPDRGAAYTRKALARAVMRITGGGNRHPAIVSEARSLGRLVPAGLLTIAELKAVLHQAAKQAGKDDEAEVEACIEWGLANPFTDGRLPEDVRHG